MALVGGVWADLCGRPLFFCTLHEGHFVRRRLYSVNWTSHIVAQVKRQVNECIMSTKDSLQNGKYKAPGMGQDSLFSKLSMHGEELCLL